MKKRFLRILSSLLVVVMIVGSAPLSGFVGLDLPNWADLFTLKADAATESGKCGANLTWSLNTDTGVLKISGTGNMYNWTSSAKVPWYSNRSSIKTVVIGDSVTSIGERAFSDCTSLTSVTIPDSVISIGDYAFCDCDDLTSITVDSNNEYYSSDSFGVLYNKDKTELIQYPMGNSRTSFKIPDSVTSIGDGAFYDCESLTSVTIPDNVTSIGKYAFDSCTSLTSVTIPDSITSIGEDAFYNTGIYNNSSNWENDVLYIGNHLIRAKTSISGDYVIKSGTKTIADSAFYDCESLTSVTIPDSVTSIGKEAFYDTGIYENASNWENNVLYIGNHLIDAKTSISGDYVIKSGTKTIADEAFSWCESLTSVTIPDSVTSIGNDAFEKCKSLTSVYITDIAAWCGISFNGVYANPLYYAENLYLNNKLVTDLVIPNNVTSIGYSAFASCKSLTSVTIPDSVTSIGRSAFSYCTSLTSVTIGDSVTSIGESAFQRCTSLTSVTIGKGVTSIGNYAFAYCDSLTSVTIGNSVTSIGDLAFYDCTSLISVTIPNSVTRIGKYAFDSCTSLTSVTIGNGVTSISDHAFASCKSLTSVTIGNGVTSISDHAFASCKSLTSVTIPDSVTSIGYCAFAYCTGLTSVTIGNSVTSIDNSAFEDCTSLTSVTIPDSVTSIGDLAFYYCTSLTSVTIPDSVTSIGNGAFRYCTSLTSVYITDIAAWCGISFNGVYANPLYYAKNLYLNNKLVTDLVIPNNVTSIGKYAFHNCKSLKSVTIPDSVTSIGKYAFHNCKSLKSVTIPDSVTSIGSNSFYDCDSLTSVYITDIAAWCGISFEDSYANPLSYAKNLYLNNKLVTDLVIPNNVTSIGEYAFYNCKSLKSVTIGDSVTSIGDRAFYDCTGLTDVYYTGTQEQWKKISIGSYNTCLTNATIHYICVHSIVKITKPPTSIRNGYSYSICEKCNTIFGNVVIIPAKGGSVLPDGSGQTMTNNELYVLNHITVYDSLHSYWENDGFSNLADYSVLTKDQACSRIWDSLKDAGEVASFSFDKLQITADYYDVYLSDMMLAFAEETSGSDVKLKALNYYSKGFKTIETFLKSSKENYEILGNFKVESAFSSDYKISKEMEESFAIVFNDAYKNNKGLFKDIFRGLDCANEICADISVGLDAYNSFKECYNAYLVARATKEMNSEFFNVCYSAANELEKTNPKFAKWFRENINKYKANSMSDAEYYQVAKKALHEFGYTAYDAFGKSVLKNVVYNSVAKVLKIPAGNISSVVAAWNIGTALADMVAPNDTDSVYYMYYLFPVEEALQRVLKKYANTLKSQGTYESASKYEVAFKTLKYTNVVLYSKMYNFASTHRTAWYKSQDMKNNMTAASSYKGLWQRRTCHSSYCDSMALSKTVGINCPVDVYLYNSNDELVLAIVNDEITVYEDDRIAVNVYDAHKAINYPADEDYKVKIVAREEGTMEYNLVSSQGDEIREIEFDNISLTANQEFSGTIPQDTDVSTNEFSLETNGTEISPVSDNTTSKDNFENLHQHTYTTEVIPPIGTTDGATVYTCSCGDTYSIVISATENIVSGKVTSFGDDSFGDTEIALYDQGEDEAAYVVTVSGTGEKEYSLAGVNPGEYTVVVTKKNHATREYALTVTETGATLDIKLHLLGDIDGDGYVKISDLSKINAHVKETKPLEGYDVACADVNSDGNVKINDLSRLNAHVKETAPLW